jgi:hypothetical protein
LGRPAWPVSPAWAACAVAGCYLEGFARVECWSSLRAESVCACERSRRVQQVDRGQVCWRCRRGERRHAWVTHAGAGKGGRVCMRLAASASHRAVFGQF